MSRIERLTPGQEAAIPLVREDWLRIGLSTEPADRPRAEEAVARVYRAAKLEPPSVILWLRSPLEGVCAAHLLSQVWDQVWDQVWAQVRAQVGDQVGAQVRDQVGAQVRDQVYRCGYGLHDASWLCWIDYFLTRCGLSVSVDPSGLFDLARSCGWWWPFEGAVILTERPCRLRRDEQGRLHSDDGAAIQYPDGWGVWVWHGVRVSQQVIEAPETLTVAQIQTERNAEVRRVMTERFGNDRYIRESGAQLVHRDDWGTLWRAEQADDEPLLMVQMINTTPEPDGSFREFWRRVHPQLRPMTLDGPVGHGQEMTALNAVASTFGLYGEEYAVLRVQT